MFRKRSALITGVLVALVGLLLGVSLVFQHKKMWKMVQYPAKPVGSRYIYSELFPMLEKMDYSPKAIPATVSKTTTKEAATYDAMERDFTRYLLRAQFDCRHRVRAGRNESEDGGWEVCLDPPFNMVRGKCLVYSFGINNEWSFDDYMDTKFGCQVHSFDPSMVEKTDFSRSKNIRFHPLGLSGTNGFVKRKTKRGDKEKWRMATLGTILQLYGHENKILDYLKMDIEASEWDSLPTMYREGVLSRVKQLGIEVHGLPKEKDLKTVLELHKLGFRIYYAKRNYRCRKTTNRTHRTIYYCLEVHFVNINFIE